MDVSALVALRHSEHLHSFATSIVDRFPEHHRRYRWSNIGVGPNRLSGPRVVIEFRQSHNCSADRSREDPDDEGSFLVVK